MAEALSADSLPDCSAQRTWLSIGPKRPERVLSFESAFSSTEGKERKRRVWPVGAVSNTVRVCTSAGCHYASGIRTHR